MTGKQIVEILFALFVVVFIYWCGYMEGYDDGRDDAVYYPDEDEMVNPDQLTLGFISCPRSENGQHCDCANWCCWCGLKLTTKKESK